MTDDNNHNNDDDDDEPKRRWPNILITGTPGVGKSAMASMVAERIPGMKHLNVGQLIKEHKCYDGRDEELESYILDEDKLLDIMEDLLLETAADPDDGTTTSTGGVVVDYHSCELFPERWFDLVLVLRTKTEVLYDRLTARGYSERKRSANMECEIMQVILDEAYSSYDRSIVHELPSNHLEDMETNLVRIEAWYHQWIKDHHADNNNDE